MYLADSRLPYDVATTDNRELGNRSIFDYVLNVDVPRGQTEIDALNKDDLLNHPNLHLHLGFGTADASVVDVDSRLRDASVTRTRTKLALNSNREFVANPDRHSQLINYGTSESIAETASTIHRPDLRPSTSCNRSCKRLTEQDFGSYTFTPLIGEMREFIANDVPLGTLAIGENSRAAFKK